jgi:predicted peptidase
MLAAMPRPHSTPRVNRAAVGVACILALAGSALQWAERTVVEVHALGSTRAPYGYVEYVPKIAGPRPLLLVLHGSGSRGGGRYPGSLIERLPPLRDVARARFFGLSSPLLDAGVLIAAPQSPDAWDVATLDAFLDHLLASRNVDRARVYLTGPSMGGCGTWRYAAAHPERLAAALPICAACAGNIELAEHLQTLPVRAVHAWDDDVVPNDWTATWIAAIAQRRGGDGENPMKTYPQGADATAVFDGARMLWRSGTSASVGETLTLTEFAHGGHDIWHRVYADNTTWRWLFAQRRSDPVP